MQRAVDFIFDPTSQELEQFPSPPRHSHVNLAAVAPEPTFIPIANRHGNQGVAPSGANGSGNGNGGGGGGGGHADTDDGPEKATPMRPERGAGGIGDEFSAPPQARSAISGGWHDELGVSATSTTVQGVSIGAQNGDGDGAYERNATITAHLSAAALERHNSSYHHPGGSDGASHGDWLRRDRSEELVTHVGEHATVGDDLAALEWHPGREQAEEEGHTTDSSTSSAASSSSSSSIVQRGGGVGIGVGGGGSLSPDHFFGDNYHSLPSLHGSSFVSRPPGQRPSTPTDETLRALEVLAPPPSIATRSRGDAATAAPALGALEQHAHEGHHRVVRRSGFLAEFDLTTGGNEQSSRRHGERREHEHRSGGQLLSVAVVVRAYRDELQSEADAEELALRAAMSERSGGDGNGGAAAADAESIDVPGILFLLTERHILPNEDGNRRLALFVSGRTVRTVFRTSFQHKAPPPDAPTKDWLAPENEIVRTKTLADMIQAQDVPHGLASSAQARSLSITSGGGGGGSSRPGEESSGGAAAETKGSTASSMVTQYFLRTPAGRTVAKSTVCAPACDLCECYRRALQAAESTRLTQDMLDTAAAELAYLDQQRQQQVQQQLKWNSVAIIADESKVAMLQAMGFDPAMAREQLQEHNNDANEAALSLMSL